MSRQTVLDIAEAESVTAARVMRDLEFLWAETRPVLTGLTS